MSMPWVGFETTIPTYVRAKTVHILDRAATAIHLDIICHPISYLNDKCTGLNSVIPKKIKIFIVIDMITTYPTVYEPMNISSFIIHMEVHRIVQFGIFSAVYENSINNSHVLYCYCCLCGLVVRVPGYRSRDTGFDFRCYQTFFKYWVWNGVHSASWV
jgi:hypothetical protein